MIKTKRIKFMTLGNNIYIDKKSGYQSIKIKKLNKLIYN